MRTKTHSQLSLNVRFSSIPFPPCKQRIEIRPKPGRVQSHNSVISLIFIRSDSGKRIKFGRDAINPVFGEFVNNKGADQPAHSRSLISAFKQHQYEKFVHADVRNYSKFYSQVISNLRTVL